MKIGLLADTHIPTAGKTLPPRVAELLAGVDLILHAGDLTVLAVLDWLERLAPVLGARGNEDHDLPPDPRLPPAPTITAAGLTIGVVHELAYPTLSLEQIFGRPVDIVVHGHTHEPMIQRQNGVLFINPGSTSSPWNRADLHGTLGLLILEEKGAHARILAMGAPRHGLGTMGS